MSCDYSVWHTASPLSSEEAGELHVRLCDGDASEVLPHPGIAAFYAELTAQHPEMMTFLEIRSATQTFALTALALQPGRA